MSGRKISREDGIEAAQAKSNDLGCAFIMIGHGSFTLIDLDDFDRVSRLSWNANTNGYAKARLGYRSVYLHRFIMEAREGQEIDHINMDKLDNRRCNLRFCTTSQNRANCKRRSHNKESVYKGVRKNSANRWSARGITNGKEKFLGCFSTEAEAAMAYDAWARGTFKEFAQLNFP